MITFGTGLLLKRTACRIVALGILPASFKPRVRWWQWGKGCSWIRLNIVMLQTARSQDFLFQIGPQNRQYESYIFINWYLCNAENFCNLKHLS